MRFEQIKKARKDNKVHKLIDEFLATKYNQVEVINENDYDNNAQMTAAIRFAIKTYYDDKLIVSRKGDRVTLKKVKAGE